MATLKDNFLLETAMLLVFPRTCTGVTLDFCAKQNKRINADISNYEEYKKTHQL